MNLTARRKGLWTTDYEISADGRRLTEWDGKTFNNGGSFELDARTYTVTAGALLTRWELADGTGQPVAVAEHVGRKRWTIMSQARTYTFERASIWRLEERLIVDGEPAGSIRRERLDSDLSYADLPALPQALQVFAFMVALAGWDVADTNSG
ncbi:hypothetical protein ACQP2X_11755 [Actinoplanes sp. CA-131856]